MVLSAVVTRPVPRWFVDNLARIHLTGEQTHWLDLNYPAVFGDDAEPSGVLARRGTQRSGNRHAGFATPPGVSSPAGPCSPRALSTIRTAIARKANAATVGSRNASPMPTT